MNTRVVVVRHPATGRELRYLCIDTVPAIASAVRHAALKFKLSRRLLHLQLGVTRHVA
jgi:hypothetical protein